MSLIVAPKAVARVATRDIRVWKLLRECNLSPVMHYRYGENMEFRAGGMNLLQKILEDRFEPARGRYWVHVGFHCFDTLKGAKAVQQKGIILGRGLKIVRCIIPAGSSYFHGAWWWSDQMNGLGTGYVTDRIRTGDLKAI